MNKSIEINNFERLLRKYVSNYFWCENYFSIISKNSDILVKKWEIIQDIQDINLNNETSTLSSFNLFLSFRLLNIVSFSENKFSRNLDFLSNISINSPKSTNYVHEFEKRKMIRLILSNGFENNFFLLINNLKEFIFRKMEEFDIDRESTKLLIKQISSLDGEFSINGKEEENDYNNLFKIVSSEYKIRNNINLSKILVEFNKYERNEGKLTGNNLLPINEENWKTESYRISIVTEKTLKEFTQNYLRNL